MKKLTYLSACALAISLLACEKNETVQEVNNLAAKMTLADFAESIDNSNTRAFLLQTPVTDLTDQLPEQGEYSLKISENGANLVSMSLNFSMACSYALGLCIIALDEGIGSSPVYGEGEGWKIDESTIAIKLPLTENGLTEDGFMAISDDITLETDLCDEFRFATRFSG